jgi:hypothetical protein
VILIGRESGDATTAHSRSAEIPAHMGHAVIHFSVHLTSYSHPIRSQPRRFSHRFSQQHRPSQAARLLLQPSQVVAPPHRRDAFLLPSARNAAAPRIPPQWRPRARRFRCRPPPSSAGPPAPGACNGSPWSTAAPSEVSASSSYSWGFRLGGCESS